MALDAPPPRAYDAFMHTLTLTIIPAYAGRTILSLARGELKVSAGQFGRMKFQGGVLLDGEPTRSDRRPAAGQTLTLVFQDNPQRPVAQSAFFPIIAYEDDDLLVINKPAPLPSVASRQGGETLENRVYSYLGCPPGFVYRPINRLDKGTSGLMVVAKNAHVQQRMQRLLHTADFVREYLAAVVGCPPEPEGLIDMPIGHGPGIRRQIDACGVPARTNYRVVANANGVSVLRLRLDTGRTHQIRVHLQALGCPVLGDFLYGSESAQLPGRFALHACRLSFCHPLSGQRIDVNAPPPPELLPWMLNM